MHTSNEEIWIKTWTGTLVNFEMWSTAIGNSKCNRCCLKYYSLRTREEGENAINNRV
jgi:hypothetical protein